MAFPQNYMWMGQNESGADVMSSDLVVEARLLYFPVTDLYVFVSFAYR